MLRASCLLVLLVVFQPRADFRTGVKVVRVDAEVSEAGRLIDGLTKDDFRVRDEGKMREIVYFGHAEEPLDVILVFDTSSSMNEFVFLLGGLEQSVALPSLSWMVGLQIGRASCRERV